MKIVATVKGQLIRSTRWCPVCSRYYPWYWFPDPIRKAYCAECWRLGRKTVLVREAEAEEEEEEEEEEYSPTTFAPEAYPEVIEEREAGQVPEKTTVMGGFEIPIPPPRETKPRAEKPKIEVPRSLTMNDYEQYWKPKGWKLLVIGPTSTWRQDWGEWEAIRDIVQNALDETEAYKSGYDDQGLWITDKGKGIGVADFLLGPPKAKPPYARGKFGEGMKIASLALLRMGYGVHVETVGRDLWMVFLESTFDTTPTYQLAALYRSDGYRQGTRFHIIGYKGPDFADRFAVNIPKKRILWEGPSRVTVPKPRLNQLLKGEEGGTGDIHASKLYARDIYMRDIASPYSYNLWGFELAPDRHAPDKENELWQDIGRLWATVNKVELLESFLRMVKDPPLLAADESHRVDMGKWTAGAVVGEKYCEDYIKENAKVWRIAWLNVMGENAVIRTDGRWDNVMKHLGYQSVSVTYLVADALSAAIDTDVVIKNNSQDRLRETQVIPDESLTPDQLAHIKLARAITQKVFTRKAPSGVYAAIIPAASDRVRTAGMYGTTTEAIFISQDILFRAQSTVDTLIHELGHHSQYKKTNEAEDLTESHAEAMTLIAAMVVKIVSSGELDEVLDGVSW